MGQPPDHGTEDPHSHPGRRRSSPGRRYRQGGQLLSHAGVCTTVALHMYICITPTPHCRTVYSRLGGVCQMACDYKMNRHCFGKRDFMLVFTKCLHGNLNSHLKLRVGLNECFLIK